MERREFLYNSSMLCLASMLMQGCGSDLIHEEGKVTRRKFKDITLPLIGLGGIRYPLTKDSTLGKIDIDNYKTKEIIKYCMKKGVNLFDTAYTYTNSKAEKTLGTVLSSYNRSDYILASKIHTSWLKDSKELLNCFNEQLKRLKTNYLDFYAVHDIKKEEEYKKFKKLGFDKVYKNLKKQKKIKYIGFSFHGDSELFDRVTDDSIWDYCYLKLNYQKFKNPDNDTIKIHNMCIKKNIPIFVMTPLEGGRLIDLKKDCLEKFKELYPDMTPVEYALKWPASQKKVATVLSGISSLKEAKENIHYFINFKEIKNDKNAIDILTKGITKLKIPCTYCGYCRDVCPQKIDIVEIFKTYQAYQQNKNLHSYKNLIKTVGGAKSCVKCMKCTHICPQSIDFPSAINIINKEISYDRKSFTGNEFYQQPLD